MAQYANLKADIVAAIYNNSNQEITGAVLQGILTQIVDTVGADYLYVGVATPTTNPGTIDQRVFYIASQAGTYTNFGGIVVAEDDGVVILKYNSSWTKETTGIASAAQLNQLGHEVDDLETDVANIEDVLDGYIWVDGVFTPMTNNSKINSTTGNIVYDTNYSYCDYIPIPQNSKRIRVSVVQFASAPAPSTNYGVAFYDSSKTFISGVSFPNSGTDENVVKEINIPATAAYARSCVFKTYTEFVCQIYVLDESLTNRVDDLYKVSTRKLSEQAQARDIVSVISLDLMQMCHSLNLINSTAIMDIVSTTESSITLASVDAANFSAETVAVVKFSDGTYKPVFFRLDSGRCTMVSRRHPLIAFQRSQ